MNRLLVAVVLLVLFCSFASAEILTQEQKHTTLNALNRACADSWCEGSYTYYFNFIECFTYDEYCMVAFAVHRYGDEGKWDKSVSDFACDIGAKRHRDVLVGDELRWSFYELMTDCIADYEEMLNGEN